MTPGALYVGGEFTDAGGIPDADRIATWNGSNWSAVSSSTSQISNGRVSAIAVSGGKVYAGGTFQNAGGDANADFLAVWDGASWEPFCDAAGPAFNGNVTSLQIIGQTLYVGGSFQDGAGIASADYLLACDLATGAASSTVLDPAHPFSGSVYALAADSNGTLYAGGGFTNLEDIAAADNVAYRPAGGTWQPMGAGAGPCGCAVTTFVRGLTTVGTDAYVGTDANDIAGIPQADHVATLERVGVERAGRRQRRRERVVPDDHLDQRADRHRARTSSPPARSRTPNGDARADNVAFFDGTEWHPVGSDGAGNGPWNGTGLALAIVDRQLYAAGSFTSAGGDPQAHSAASFALTQIIAYPTPTVTAGPDPVPTPTVTASPNPVPTPTVTPDSALTSSRPPRRFARRRSTQASARRRSGSPPASRAPRSPASSTRRGSGPARRRRPTGSSSPASTCSASRRATAPATSMPRRRSSGSGSGSGHRDATRRRAAHRPGLPALAGAVRRGEAGRGRRAEPQPLAAEAIADAVGARASQLRRVLRALVVAGVFEELEDGRFACNDAAATLRADAPGRMRDTVINFGEEMYRSFGELLHTVRTGETAFDHVYGAAVRVLRGEPGDGGERGGPHAGANPARGSRVRRVRRPTRRPDARGCRRWGGGPAGGGPAPPSRDHRRPAGAAGDARAREGLPRRAGRGDRCELVEGDFFSSVPPGGDVYVLKSVLHDWDDERCVAILRSCRAAMSDAARLVIVELLLPAHMTPSATSSPRALLDLIMLAFAGGRERTEAEFAALLDQAGLRLTGTTALNAGPQLLEAVVS